MHKLINRCFEVFNLQMYYKKSKLWTLSSSELIEALKNEFKRLMEIDASITSLYWVETEDVFNDILEKNASKYLRGYLTYCNWMRCPTYIVYRNLMAIKTCIGLILREINMRKYEDTE